ncbi:hypothetical protein PV04_09826 [Phialophora macrospora]|uniref:Uncharacterized protein n=1 Tax=Phialophora macrospora TaxID=1851006 RepID=A0A0D2FSC8_9EURO|nr:hypothetical protein PV04_09826 [Phialophora macrospora]
MPEYISNQSPRHALRQPRSKLHCSLTTPIASWIRCAALPRSDRGGYRHGDGDCLTSDTVAQTVEKVGSERRGGSDSFGDGHRSGAAIGSRGRLRRQALAVGSCAEPTVVRCRGAAGTA